MKYEEISPAMREFIGYYEALRRLGFPAGSIYCFVAPTGEAKQLTVFAHLEYAGREFNVECGPAVGDKDAVVVEYKAICDAFANNTISTEDDKRLWLESTAYRRAGALAVALLLKGIELPLREELDKPRALN